MDQTNDLSMAAKDAGQISIEARVSDLVRLGIIGLFAYWTVLLIAPFALIVVWSAILAVALYPMFNALSRLIGNRPVIAATVIVVACLVLIIAPVALVAVNFADAVEGLVGKLQAESFALPAAPESIRAWPVIGERLYAGWNKVAGDLASNIIEYQKPILHVMGIVVAKLASISGGVLSFVASVILSGFFLTQSTRLAETIQVLASRVAGDRASASPSSRGRRSGMSRAASSALPSCRR